MRREERDTTQWLTASVVGFLGQDAVDGRSRYADLFDEDLDDVADRLNAAVQITANGLLSTKPVQRPELRKRGGAKGIRTPDLLDANETRYQLRHSPLR
jgi:hypothetical protein